MKRSYPFNSQGDRFYNADDVARTFRDLMSSGIIIAGGGVLGDELQVTAGSGMVAVINWGKAVVKGRFMWLYDLTGSDQKEQLSLNAGHATLGRIDRIVLEMNLNDVVRDVRLKVLEGTPASSPVAPSLTRNDIIYQLSLARINVPALATTLGTITDERADSTLCGVCQFTPGIGPIFSDQAAHIVLSDEAALMCGLTAPDKNVDKAVIKAISPNKLVYAFNSIDTANPTNYIKLLKGKTYTIIMISAGAINYSGGLVEFQIKPAEDTFYPSTINSSLVSFGTLASITHATTSAVGTASCTVPGAHVVNGNPPNTTTKKAGNLPNSVFLTERSLGGVGGVGWNGGNPGYAGGDSIALSLNPILKDIVGLGGSGTTYTNAGENGSLKQGGKGSDANYGGSQTSGNSATVQSNGPIGNGGGSGGCNRSDSYGTGDKMAGGGGGGAGGPGAGGGAGGVNGCSGGNGCPGRPLVAIFTNLEVAS